MNALKWQQKPETRGEKKASKVQFLEKKACAESHKHISFSIFTTPNLKQYDSLHQIFVVLGATIIMK